MSEHQVKLSDISERLLVPWYFRDIRDYEKYQHRNVRYKLNRHFDPNNPEVAQIVRVKLDMYGDEKFGSRQYLCLYCRCPFFCQPLLELGILAHIAGHHSSVDFPTSESVKKLFLNK